MNKDDCIKFVCILHGKCEYEVEENCGYCERVYNCDSCVYKQGCKSEVTEE